MTAMVILAAAAFLSALLVRRRDRVACHWGPSRHGAVAMGSGLCAFCLSALLLCWANRSVAAAQFVQYGLLYVGCGFALPWGYTLLITGRGPAAMGLSTNKLRTSLIVNVLLGIIFGVVMLLEARERGIDLRTYQPQTVVLGSFVLLAGLTFELFLYFGFIHLQLERDFGTIPAIIGTSAVYVLWHTGTQLPYEPDVAAAMIKLFLVGVLYQSVFSTTRNLMVVWPFFALSGVLIDFMVNLQALRRMQPYWPGAMGAFVGMAACGFVIGLAWRRRRKGVSS